MKPGIPVKSGLGVEVLAPKESGEPVDVIYDYQETHTWARLEGRRLRQERLRRRARVWFLCGLVLSAMVAGLLGVLGFLN